MATREETELIMRQLEEANPEVFFHPMNETKAGIGAVLRFLYESEGPVTAGNISEYMGVSTARVAVLLKKMAAKGLIIKETPDSDGRVTVVRLSEHGNDVICRMHDAMYEHVRRVIDKVGMERVLEFTVIAKEIRNAVDGETFGCGEFLEEKE